VFRYVNGLVTSLYLLAIGTSGVRCKSFNAAEAKASTVIVVSRGIFVELGGGPTEMSMPFSTKT